jgi:hypothetical protein
MAYSDGKPPDLRFPYSTSATAYYKTGGKDPASIRAFPAGLKVVAGHPHGTTPRGERKGVVSWHCIAKIAYPDDPSEPTIPDCPTGKLVLRVAFPDCWNGRSLDGAEHRSHMAYARRRPGRRFMVCPASHPVPVPALSLGVTYFFQGGTHKSLQLASGPPRTAHADFFNAWDQAELDRLVRVCINARKSCGARRTP